MTALSFEKIAISENNDPLVDLSFYPFVLQPVYFNQGHSETDKMHLRKSLADKLLKVQKGFNGKYRFKIWDGHRPRKVQDSIYNEYYSRLKVKNPDWEDDKLINETQKFVTLASKSDRIPPHSTGGSVDLTIVDFNGNELDMGTPFDYFGPEAGAMYYEVNDIDETVKLNRKLLRESLESEGFSIDADEWWHFDYGNQLWAYRLSKPQAFYGETSVAV